jgi:hypothetical protein
VHHLILGHIFSLVFYFSREGLSQITVISSAEYGSRSEFEKTDGFNFFWLSHTVDYVYKGPKSPRKIERDERLRMDLSPRSLRYKKQSFPYFSCRLGFRGPAPLNFFNCHNRPQIFFPAGEKLTV